MVLTETCRFLSVSPTDFIASTLSLTLPNLFASCDDKALETIANELSKKLSILFLNFAREILAHVFLLSTPVQVNNALAFILKVLRDAADNQTIDLRSVVISHVIPLLAELVVVMGDQDPEQAKKVGVIPIIVIYL
jgi:serine/threonine-protein kinase ATR